MSPCLVKQGDWWRWWLKSSVGPGCCTGCWWCPAMPCHASELKSMCRKKRVYGSSSTQFPSRAPSGPVWSIAKWGWLFVYGYFWRGLDTSWRQLCVLCHSGSSHCKGTGSCSDRLLFWAWVLSLNSSRNLMFRVFGCACNWTSWLFAKNMKSDSPGINRAWFSVNPVSWLIYFLI